MRVASVRAASHKPEGISFTVASGVDIIPVLALVNEYETVVIGKLRHRN